MEVCLNNLNESKKPKFKELNNVIYNHLKTAANHKIEKKNVMKNIFLTKNKKISDYDEKRKNIPYIFESNKENFYDNTIYSNSFNNIINTKLPSNISIHEINNCDYFSNCSFDSLANYNFTINSNYKPIYYKSNLIKNNESLICNSQNNCNFNDYNNFLFNNPKKIKSINSNTPIIKNLKLKNNKNYNKRISDGFLYIKQNNGKKRNKKSNLNSEDLEITEKISINGEEIKLQNPLKNNNKNSRVPNYLNKIQIAPTHTIFNKFKQNEIINDKKKMVYCKKLSSYILKNNKIYSKNIENENKLIKNILRKNNTKSYECIIFKKKLSKSKKLKYKNNRRNKTFDILSEKIYTPIQFENDKGGKVNLFSYINKQLNPYYTQKCNKIKKYFIPTNKICYISKTSFLLSIQKINLLQKNIKIFLLKKKHEKEKGYITTSSINNFFSISNYKRQNKKYDSKKLNKRNINQIYLTKNEVKYQIGNYVFLKKLNNRSINKNYSKNTDKITLIKDKKRIEFFKCFNLYNEKIKSQRSKTPNLKTKREEKYIISYEIKNQILSNKNIYIHLPINQICIFTKQSINILNKKIKNINKYKLINIKGGYISKKVKYNLQLFFIKYLQENIKYYISNKKNNTQKIKEIIYKPKIPNNYMSKKYKIINKITLENPSLMNKAKDVCENNNNTSQSLITTDTKKSFYNRNIMSLLNNYFNVNKIKLFCSILKNVYFSSKFNSNNFVNITFEKHPKKKTNSTEFNFSFNNNDTERDRIFSNAIYHNNSFRRYIYCTIEKINNEDFQNNENNNEEIDIFKKRKKDTQCLVQNAIINQIFKEYKNNKKKYIFSEDYKNLSIRGSKQSSHGSNLSSGELKCIPNKSFDKNKDEKKICEKLLKKKKQYL